MSSHQCPKTTPGPWHISPMGSYGDFDGKSRIIIGDDRRICAVHAYPGDHECKANARVIAAAPLMYEALANLENDDGKNMPDTAWKLVQDALSAARGETA
ncbi:MAG: hypothetical protein AAGD43_09355 [Pseudomonadota bacterium]